MLISDIRDEIISEVGGDVDDTDLQDKVLGFIVSSLRRLPDKARVRTVISKKSVTLSSGLQTATLPDGFLEERVVWYETDGARKNIDLPKDTRDFNAAYTTSGSGAPSLARIYGTIIEFDKPADQDYTIYIDCFVECDDVDAADTFGHNSNIAEKIKDAAKYYYYSYIEKDEKAKEFAGIFEDGMIKLDGKYQRNEQPDHVVES